MELRKTCRMQLNFSSLLKLILIISIGYSFVISALAALFVMLYLQEINFAGLITNLIFAPIFSIILALFLTIFSYPFYIWYCKRNRGQKLEGIFVFDE